MLLSLNESTNMPTDKINGCGRANNSQLEFQNSVTNLSFLHYREGFLYKSFGGGGRENLTLLVLVAWATIFVCCCGCCRISNYLLLWSFWVDCKWFWVGFCLRGRVNGGNRVELIKCTWKNLQSFEYVIKEVGCQKRNLSYVFWRIFKETKELWPLGDDTLCISHQTLSHCYS